MINDGINNVPDNTLCALVYGKDKSVKAIKDLKGDIRRDWFSDLFYFCLPITFANQIGFAVISLFDFSVIWDGGKEVDSVFIESNSLINEEIYNSGDHVYGNDKQKVSSFFGHGTFSIFNDFILRTPNNVNLMFTQAPNYFIPGVSPMTAILETDNLTRDFAMTFKITVPNIKIDIKSGDVLAVLIPMQRGFPDSFELKNAEDLFDIKVLSDSVKVAHEHEKVAREIFEKKGFYGKTEEDDEKKIGIYYKGYDPYGKKFNSHQKKPGHIILGEE